MMLQNPHYLVKQLWAAGLYMLFMALTIPFEKLEIVACWPAAGIAFALVLLEGQGILLGIALGLTVAHLAFTPVDLSFYWFSLTANVASPWLACYLLQRFGGRDISAVRVRNTFWMLVGGAVLSLASATIGTIGLLFNDYISANGFPAAWFRWWVGNFFGVIVCSPCVVSIVLSWRRYKEGEKRAFHAPMPEVLIWASMFVVMWGLGVWYGHKSTNLLALSNLPMALFIWSALRFPPVYTYLSVALTLLGGLLFASLGHFGSLDLGSAPAIGVWVLLFSVMAVLPQLVAAANHERQYFESKLVYRANHDRLTGLRNRNAFEDHATAVLLDSEHTHEPLAMAYLDLDQFKIVNDSCSHAVGDNLIRQMAAVLDDQRFTGDVIARMGGDEFAILFRNASPAEAEQRAESLRHEVESFRFIWQKKMFAFTVSIGLVVLKPNLSFTKQLSMADTACTRAKDTGRNRVIVIDHDDSEISRYQHEVEWVVRINDALSQNRFRLYCQPIVPVFETNEPYRHFEVLLRMLDQNGNVLTPGSFIPAAERFHLMKKLDCWVVESTLKWLEAHQESLASVNLCSINLSGPSLTDYSFQRFMKEVILKHQVPAHKICFEITETAAIGDLSQANRFIKSIRKLGCSFALDDFGSGLASFGYLKTLHVDYLKIDGAFVRDIARAPIDLAMVKSINEVGHVMGKKTIAEFVESEEVLRELRKLGVDYAQGYAVGRPAPIHEYFHVEPSPYG